MDGIFRAMNIEDEDIQCKALEALAEVPPVGYNSLAEYVPRIGEVTIRFMQKEDTANQAKSILGFWISLGEAEQRMMQEGTSMNIIG